MKIAIGADHAGFRLKEDLKALLGRRGHDVEDLGTGGDVSVDYPDFAVRVARAVAEGRAERGLLVCGTGIGMSMTANKVPGVRAAVCTDDFTARMARAHNDANVLCLGARVLGTGVAESALEAFLATAFEGGRHERRVEKIRALDVRPPRPTG
jgi:ribose 5-phosphate isomerase B